MFSFFMNVTSTSGLISVAVCLVMSTGTHLLAKEVGGKNWDHTRLEKFIAKQVSLTPRGAGQPGKKPLEKFLLAELAPFSKKIISQQWTVSYEIPEELARKLYPEWGKKATASKGSKAPRKKRTITFRNILVRFFPQLKERILVGGHYDVPQWPEYEKKKTPIYHQPVPGANDGASGTALLLELARVIHGWEKSKLPVKKGIDLLFIDGEEGLQDQGGEWRPLGSEYFVQHLHEFYSPHPPSQLQLALIVDMVCDKDLTLYYEENSLFSARRAMEKVWNLGHARYPKIFIKKSKYAILDDHIPFMKAQIPAMLIIDFDNEFRHTTLDTVDKCSFENLSAVGRILEEYLHQEVK